MNIIVYTFEKADGSDYGAGSYSTQDYDYAVGYARQTRTRLIANTYEWADSEMLEDFTKDS